mmetsp:Transcript_18665/g.55673  ORF Transcript_18665/g.55673 Transcript_18665/m.55673 type:complete len:224 (-) Transcript_18665:797-1468(-)
MRLPTQPQLELKTEPVRCQLRRALPSALGHAKQQPAQAAPRQRPPPTPLLRPQPAFACWQRCPPMSPQPAPAVARRGRHRRAALQALPAAARHRRRRQGGHRAVDSPPLWHTQLRPGRKAQMAQDLAAAAPGCCGRRCCPHAPCAAGCRARSHWVTFHGWAPRWRAHSLPRWARRWHACWLCAGGTGCRPRGSARAEPAGRRGRARRSTATVKRAGTSRRRSR